MDFTFWIGTSAAVCSIVSFVPQAWKIIKTRDTSGISLAMYSITVTAFALWILYGAMLGQWPLIASNLICLVLASFILAMKVLPPDQKEDVAKALDP